MHAFLANFAMVLVVAALTSVVCQRLRLPVVFGYLLAGMIVGPNVPVALVADPDIVATLAELGVILLMFALGLEFSLSRLLRLGLVAGFTALLEIGFSFWLGYLAARWAGLSTTAGLFLGGALCISSTTIIARVFAEKRPERGLRERVFGVLLVEDLAAVLLLAVLTAVAAGRGLTLGEVGTVTARLMAFLVALVLGGLLVIPRFFRVVLRLGRAETLLVAGVGICFGIAVLAQRLGYSVALGGFLAGMLIAETGRGAELERLVQPLRDLFAAIFFVAVGMMIVPGAVLEHWQLVLALSALVIAAKFIGLTAGVFLTGGGLRLAVQAGMAMGQIGEFSFIIAGLGRAAGVLPGWLYSVIVAVSALTTLLTPLAVAQAARVAGAIDGALPTALQNYLALYGTWVASGSSTVGLGARFRRLAGLVALDAAAMGALIIGSSLVWKTLLATARSAGLSPGVAQVVLATLLGLPIAVFAMVVAVNSKKLALLLADGCLPLLSKTIPSAEAPRRALVTSMHAAVLLAVLVPLFALVQPFIPPLYGTLVVLLLVLPSLAVAWRRTIDLQGHLAAGAQAITETLLRRARPAGTEEEAVMAQVRALLPGIGDPVTVHLADRDYAVGSTLAELNLRARTDATVLAIVHAGRGVNIPSGREPLEAGDVLALAGTPAAVAAAAELLRRGRTGATEA